MDPAEWSAIAGKGVSPAEKGHLEESLVWLDRALAENPEDAKTWRNRAMVEVQRANSEAAFDAMVQAIKRDPGGYAEDFRYVCGACGKRYKKEWKKIFPDGVAPW